MKLRIAAGMVALLAGPVAAQEAVRRAEELTTHQERLARLVLAAGVFKSRVVEDAQAAWASYATPLARRRAEALGDYVAVDLPRAQTWGWLLGGACFAIGREREPEPVIGFYNPWCDVVLLTTWGEEGARFSITDLELLPGDTLRADTLPVPLLPPWRRGGDPPPLALGRAAAETVRAFERAFPSDSFGSWRRHLPSTLRREGGSRAALAGAGLRIAGGLRGPEKFLHAAHTEGAGLARCRAELERCLRLARGGQAAALLAGATRSEPEVARRLAALPPAGWARLQLAGVTAGPDGVVVFLARVNGPPGAIALTILDREGRAALARADVIDFAAFLAVPTGEEGR